MDYCAFSCQAGFLFGTTSRSWMWFFCLNIFVEINFSSILWWKKINIDYSFSFLTWSLPWTTTRSQTWLSSTSPACSLQAGLANCRIELELSQVRIPWFPTTMQELFTYFYGMCTFTFFHAGLWEWKFEAGVKLKYLPLCQELNNFVGNRCIILFKKTYSTVTVIELLITLKSVQSRNV